MMLLEWPHQRVETVEMHFIFMHSCYIDLGFENLGIQKLYVPLTMGGLKIPGIDYMMFLDREGTLRITRGGHTLPHLPFDWFSATYGVKGSRYLWIGPKVRQDQIGDLDQEQLQNACENYERFEPRTYGFDQVSFA